MQDDLLDSDLIQFSKNGDRVALDLEKVGRVIVIARLGNIVVGNRLTDEYSLPDGRYKVFGKQEKYEIIDNTITEEFYIEHFHLRNGDRCSVDCSRVRGFYPGASISSNDGQPLATGVYRLKLLRWVAVEAGQIIRIGLFANSVSP